MPIPAGRSQSLTSNAYTEDFITPSTLPLTRSRRQRSRIRSRASSAPTRSPGLSQLLHVVDDQREAAWIAHVFEACEEYRSRARAAQLPSVGVTLSWQGAPAACGIGAGSKSPRDRQHAP